ncbi:hypothetical protein C8J57DRAFT_1477302 [Mycena rebaudengoi]|nr:hypothetical protein C8J57DRAFT_1477302 [Mycena rebaudengoi]
MDEKEQPAEGWEEVRGRREQKGMKAYEDEGEEVRKWKARRWGRRRWTQRRGGKGRCGNDAARESREREEERRQRQRGGLGAAERWREWEVETKDAKDDIGENGAGASGRKLPAPLQIPVFPAAAHLSWRQRRGVSQQNRSGKECVEGRTRCSRRQGSPPGACAGAQERPRRVRAGGAGGVAGDGRVVLVLKNL